MSTQASRASGSHSGARHWPKVVVATVAVTVAVTGGMLLNRGGNDTSSTTSEIKPASALPGRPSHASTSEATQPTAFIVTSSEVAASLRTAIDEADRIRATDGLPPSGDVVVLAESSAAAKAVESAIVDFNPLAVANGLPEMRVIRFDGADVTELPNSSAAH